MSEIKKVVVVGSGAFGTALAAVIAQTGKVQVTLMARTALLAEELIETHEHKAALPGIRLPDQLQFTTDAACLSDADVVLFAMPSQSQRDAARRYAPEIKPGATVVICAKGIEQATGKMLTSALEEELSGLNVAVLSGPGFAADIAAGLPTAMVIAAAKAALAKALAESLSGASFRLYPSTDRIGVQLGGALKNVLAIACGIVEGAGLGDSARAALIARGLAEMSRFVATLGGSGETVVGLSGLGDLVLTATSHQSRNLRFGIALGSGENDVAGSGDLVEGAYTAAVSAKLAARLGIEMPITEAVAAIIEGKVEIKDALAALMSRPIKQE
ncbi:NAD(P)H-dependent glycerol-3-phosphate dehydrogenase [Rhizobium sp. L1K21]|uniref:NAD(P)H-dependent glycerol-3-phosphate dehydrogenase n=1 Tax=Rhizobium sp. L1K21 TaxID=2954933 RepID=UPI002093077E|nr:NAD(P)H-dependent glycerol-3-phosphate dehydrogenase [Rhizobium sp. L1K21]MCO6184874.1 NAD(P)-dependent glycerol-3-phosphate dehydrogenase [Rhizobium sp. L1K21]